MYAQRRPALHRLLDCEHELNALLSLLLDGHSLWTADATLAEGLYSLKRMAVAPKGVRGGNGGSSALRRLTSRQRWSALLVVVRARRSARVCMCVCTLVAWQRCPHTRE